MDELKSILVNYFEQYPNLTEEDILRILTQAKREANLRMIPEYQPLKVEDQSRVDDYYNEIHEVQKRVVRKDESTHLTYSDTEYE